MADSKVIKVVKSSQLLSNLSTMKDEVRDRTIFVQVTSECHSWSDVEIVALFSEFGRVEEVKLLSTGNHFHSQIRYQTEYDRECACYYYQDGWLVHQNCCEIQVYRAEDIVCVNAQRIDNIQAANVISANSKVLNSTGLLEETLMNKEVVSQAEESTQLLPEDSLDFVAQYLLDQMPKKEPNSAHDSSGLAALKVFEEMPGSTVNGDLILVDEIANKNEEPLDDILECVVCFDPGGSRLIESDHAISLSNMGCEDEVAKAEKSTHIWKNEQVTVKEFSYFADQRMLNEMLKSKKCCEVELSAEFRTFATPWAESSEDILALERQNSTVTVIKAFREVMMVFNLGNLSFDPGGFMVIYAIISLIARAEKPEMFYSYCVETLMYGLGDYADGFSSFLQTYNLEVQASLYWSVAMNTIYANQMSKAITNAPWNAYCSRICCGNGKLEFMANDWHIEDGHYAEIFGSKLGVLFFPCDLLVKDINFSSAVDLIVVAAVSIVMRTGDKLSGHNGLFPMNAACLDTFCFDPGGNKLWYVQKIKELWVTLRGNHHLVAIIRVIRRVYGCLVILVFDPGGNIKGKNLSSAEEVQFEAYVPISLFSIWVRILVVQQIYLGIEEFSWYPYEPAGFDIYFIHVDGFIFDPGGVHVEILNPASLWSRLRGPFHACTGVVQCNMGQESGSLCDVKITVLFLSLRTRIF